MKNLIKSSVTLAISLVSLVGCAGTPGTTSVMATSTNTAYSLAADQTTVTTNASGNPQSGNRGKGGPGGDRGQKGQGGGFGLPAELNLTAEQKTQLDALKPAAPTTADQATMDANRTAMDAVRKEINAAFVTDTFDTATFKTKLAALRPAQTTDRSTQEADRIVKTYNILTAEQRTILETKQAEMAAKTPTVRPTPDATQADTRFDKLATDLSLTDAQKTSLKAALQPPTHDETAEQAKRKATQDAVNAALKAGNATTESIAAILKANAPTKEVKVDEIDRLATIHDILNTDQRTKFIASNNAGFGGPGGHEGGHGGQGGPRM